VLLRLARLLREKQWTGKVEIVFFDLGTAVGLAEAAFCQLEGETPAILVETEVPGPVISGERPSRVRKGTYAGVQPHVPLLPFPVGSKEADDGLYPFLMPNPN
jgi:hypothetical protein